MHRPRLTVTLAAVAAAIALAAVTGDVVSACRAEEPAPPAAPQAPKSGEPGEAAKAAAAEKERLEVHLKAVAAKLGGLRTLTASFTQRKYLEVFKEEVVSAGTLALAGGGRLRWEFTTPVRSVLIVNGDRGRRERTSRRGVKTSANFALASDPVAAATAEQVFLWMQGDFEKARLAYDLKLEPAPDPTPAAPAPSPAKPAESAAPGAAAPAAPATKDAPPPKPPVVVATPRDERVAKVISSVRLRFAADLSALAEVVLEERGGARTVITFTDVRRDVKLDDALFGVGDE